VLRLALAMTDLEQEIRRRVSAFVAGQSSFEDFSLAFAPLTWDVPADDPAAQRLASEAELAVAEFTSGHRTEHQLRQELARFLGSTLDVSWVSGALNAHRGRQIAAPVRTQASNAIRREAVPA